MFNHLKGILHHKSPTEIVVDVNGVGYAVSIPLSTFEKLGDVGSPVLVLTHLHVREDILQLFGFATEPERDMFRLLLSVSGIGPKIAQGILSGAQPKELQSLIAQGNVGALTAIPGIGKKTAERLIVELRDRIAKIGLAQARGEIPEGGESIRAEALMALISLGYNRLAAEKAIRSALNELTAKDLTIQELLKHALKSAGR
jgi:holliday junction DNA helicase RuvA